MQRAQPLAGQHPPRARARLAGLCLCLGLGLLVAPRHAHALPGYDEVRAGWRPSDTLVLDRRGETLQRLRTDSGARRGQWTALADVSPALRTALILGEDRRFHEHSGVDWRAVSAAAWGNLWNTRTRGASTITMQLAGLLDEQWRAGPGGRNPAQKLGQAVAAQVLERRWRKDQILEAYLNLVPLRGELVGVDAMARSLFGKAPHGLDERESAIAAALVRAPNASARAVSRRACALLREMNPGRADTCDGLDAWTDFTLARRAWPATEGIAPHAARQALRAIAPAPAPPTGTPAALPARINTTLDARIQRAALGLLQRQLRELRTQQVEDGAVIVLDNASGDVLAWVGSSGELSDAPEVDAVLAPRQAGSTLKPFLYAQAIAQRRLSAASLLEDSPAQIDAGAGLYIPQNYDRQFKGWVSVRTALGASLNVPAVRTLSLVSAEAFGRQLRALGLPLKEDGDYYGHSLALGSAEVTLLSLTNAYRALANGGRLGVARMVAAPAAKTQAQPQASPPVIDPGAAWIVSDILADGNARARSFGTDSVLATRVWSAVKTGTSKDMRDNWAVGYTRRYTVGVWVGNASGESMRAVSGVSGAAPVWAALVSLLHATGQPGGPVGGPVGGPAGAQSPPPPPAGVVQVALRYADGIEPARPEWFLSGTEQTLVQRSLPQTMAARITEPVNGTIIALDPDIPPERQRLQLQAQGDSGGGAGAQRPAGSAAPRWLLNGQPLARGLQAQWLPWPGRHLITLTDASGQVLDEVRVEVRGAGVRGRTAPRNGLTAHAPQGHHATNPPAGTSPRGGSAP